MAQALRGKVAIVTGAGGGIGRAVSLQLASDGARVVVNDPGVSIDGSGVAASPADKVVAEIGGLGGEALANYENVALFSTGESLVKTALDAFGRLDIVVTCAGIIRDRMVFNMTEEEWDAVINVHLKGTFNVVRHACGVFRQQRSGHIITITSDSGLFGNAGQANYAAAKAGIAGFTKVVARDMGRYGVTCNAIVPRAWTRMTTAGGDQQMQQLQQLWDFETTGGGPLQETPWTPEDIAPFFAFLASDYAADVNGQIFMVYGNTIELLNQPRMDNVIAKAGSIWNVDELREVLPKTLVRDLVNPAPPQPPRQ